MDIQEEEAWALHTTLKFVSSQGLQHVQFKMDFKSVVDKIKNSLDDDSKLGF